MPSTRSPRGTSRGALLPEKDDEIGTLAARFNAMTNYLREAREKEARANAARLALETRLRHSEKLATIGQMAAEIAHEVGTPLNVIGGRARSLARRSQDAADVQKNADIITAQVERITRIIRQVLRLLAQEPPHPHPRRCSPRWWPRRWNSSDELLRRQRIEPAVAAPRDLPRIPGRSRRDPAGLPEPGHERDSRHAGGRHLRIALDHVIRRKEGLALSPPRPTSCWRSATPAPACPAADRDKIFEPFFTTKDAGEGTGLGLAVAKGIVKDHDGWIEVDDRPEGGAVFRVFLPVSDGGTRRGGQPTALPNLPA